MIETRTVCRRKRFKKSYKKKFEYCKETDYKYDHKDYYNIPGLCYDENIQQKVF